MKPSLRAKLERTLVRLQELNGLLAAEDATRDLAQFRNLSREYAEASGLAALYARYRRAEADAQAAQEMSGDPATREFAESEIKLTRERLAVIEA